MVKKLSFMLRVLYKKKKIYVTMNVEDQPDEQNQ